MRNALKREIEFFFTLVRYYPASLNRLIIQKLEELRANLLFQYILLYC